MSFEDLKEHLLKQDDRHKSNRVITVGNGKIESAPNYDIETSLGSSDNGSIEELEEQINKQDDKHAPNHVLKPTGKINPAPIYDEETAFKDGM